MLLFSTILDINEKLTYEKFFELVVFWNDNQYYEENRITGLKWTGEFGKKIGSPNLWISFEKYESTVAVRYEKRTQDGVKWDTDYVMNFRSMKMAVRLERSYSDDIPVMDATFSSPYFITHLIDKGYLKKDNNLAFQRDPIYVNNSNIEQLANVVNSISKYRFPVIYVSKTFNNEDPVDVNILAKRLRGIAHVLVQEDVALNRVIQNACSSKNEYKGSIGIYFPGSSVGHKTLMYRREVGADPMLLDKVIQIILRYCNSHESEPLLTWQGINNAQLLESLNRQQKAREEFEAKYRESEEKRKNIEADLSEEGERLFEEAQRRAKSEADELLAVFDEEQEKLRKQIDDLTSANNALLVENERLRKKINETDNMPLLYRGEEDDFYAGEVKDLILSTLEKAIESIPDKTRRADVVRDIVENNGYERISESNAEKIKRLLKNYDGMSSKIRQALKDLGFEISEDGKHYKVTYYGDGRYQMAYSKTPSDVRTGKNMVQKTVNLIC